MKGGAGGRWHPVSGGPMQGDPDPSDPLSGERLVGSLWQTPKAPVERERCGSSRYDRQERVDLAGVRCCLHDCPLRWPGAAGMSCSSRAPQTIRVMPARQRSDLQQLWKDLEWLKASSWLWRLHWKAEAPKGPAIFVRERQGPGGLIRGKGVSIGIESICLKAHPDPSAGRDPECCCQRGLQN
jgi:hypothetical protein